MTTDTQHLTDQGDPRKYFAMIEHMADDDLDPYEYRLLGHYKRVCGEKNGKCTESVRTTAEKCKMSVGQVSETRASLATKGWLILKIHKEKTEKGNWLITGSTVTLMDRWAENVARYAKSTPSHDEQGCSYSEQVQGETCSCGEQGCSCGETKKNLELEKGKRSTSAKKAPDADAVVPDDFKAIQEYTVVTVFKSNDRMYGKAGDIANWALCRNDKPQWAEWKPDRPFTMYEWITFLAWYAVKDIAWPSSGEKWNKQAFEWRATPECRQLMKPRRTEPPLTDEMRMANVHELMTPFPTGGDE